MNDFDLMPVQEVYNQPTLTLDYDWDYKPQFSEDQVNDHQFLEPISLTFGREQQIQKLARNENYQEYNWDHQRLHDNTNHTRLGNNKTFTGFMKEERSAS